MQITRKLIISSTLWAAVTQGAVMLINLFVLPLFIKNLGAELYGIWILSGVVLGYAGVFDFGFTQGLQKYVAEARVKKDDQELSEVVVTGLGLLSVIGILLGILIYFGAPSIVSFFNIKEEQSDIALQLLQISAIFSVVTWPLRIVDVVLNACMRIKELSLLNGFKSVTQSILMLLMILYSSGIIQIKWVTTSVAFLVSLYGIILLRKYIPEICWNFENFKFKQIVRMQRFSLGMFYSSLIAVLAVQIDSVIIGKMLTMSAVAAYAIAAKPYQMIQSLMMLAVRAIQPAAYNLRAANDNVRLEKLVSQGVRIRSIAAIPTCVVAFLCIPQFIILWVGPDFIWVVPWAKCFVLVPVFSCLGVGGQICSTSSRGIVLANVIGSFRTGFNILISLFLISTLGIGGPILGTIISYALLGSLVMCYVYCRFMNISSRAAYGYFFKTIIVSVFAGILCFPLLIVEVGGGWYGLLAQSTVMAAVQLFFAFFFLITKVERASLLARCGSILDFQYRKYL